MALRATIFKLDLHVADMVRGYYNSHNLTLARHPSENDERMMARILAFALFADEQLSFTRGLSTADEPSLWQKDLTGDIRLWIDLGHPDERRLLQASGKSDRVVVCCYGGQASLVWWKGMQKAAERMPNLAVLSIDPNDLKALANMVQRSMSLHVNIDENAVLVSSGDDSRNVTLETWR